MNGCSRTRVEWFSVWSYIRWQAEQCHLALLQGMKQSYAFDMAAAATGYLAATNNKVEAGFLLGSEVMLVSLNVLKACKYLRWPRGRPNLR